ncbi:MAG: hypothetical protein U1D00_02360 [Mycobacterium sp.]|nr:hypothetical protein [Mycobacterium sp.]
MTGLRFRETMTGRIALRALDPVDGYERVDGFATTMHITIDIADVAAFIAGRPDESDTSHEAVMRADVVIPVLGGRFVTANGRFICFESGQGPDGTPVQQMLYTADLVNDDRIFRMTARKVLEPKGWRIWRDTTRLQVKLVDITDDDSTTADGADRRPRQLAGVVSITVAEFARQLMSMRPYGDGGWWARWRAVGAYLTFFVKGLFRIYLGTKIGRLSRSQ